MPAKKVFFILLSINILLLGVIGATFTVASSIAANKSKAISQTKADIEANEQAIKGYETLEMAITNNQEISEIAAKVLPQDKEQTAALAELDKFSRESGVPIRQLAFNPGKNGSLVAPSGISGVSVISVSISCQSAPYQNLLNFLKKIEDNRRRMQVTSTALSPNERNSNQLERIDLTIDLYLKP